MTGEQLLPVVQADRDRAADHTEEALRVSADSEFIRNIRSGLSDDYRLVQTLAAHRLAATPTALPSAEDALREALEPLAAMLRAIVVEEGCTIFEHTAEEIGIAVMENYAAVLSSLRGPNGAALPPQYTPYHSVADCDTAAIRAVRLLEDAESFNANCDECEGEGVPELCATCFPLFDAARVERRLVMQSLAALQSPRASDEVLGEASGANRDCLTKAKPGEPMFIILGRDPDGGNIVRLWAERRRDAGDPDHALPVLTLADAMDAWRAAGNLPDSAPPAEAYPALSASPVPVDASGADAARETIRDALMDSQYLAGVTAGWNAAQSDDPNAALARLQASRSGHLAGFKAAKATLSHTAPVADAQAKEGE